ncbi:ATP-dependent Clp protease proteolytic subunit [Akkermansiaceae bacterium]|nr:ATP-dependent Clp protease proteolytic subunit [Akkermansiaceae bacterium]
MLKITLTLTAGYLLTSSAFSQEAKEEKEAPKAKPAAEAVTENVAVKKLESTAKAEEPKSTEEAELSALTLENNLIAEKHKKETAQLRMEVARLKLEKELFSERLTSKSMKESVENVDELVKHEADVAKMKREAEIAKVKLETLSSQLKTVQAEAALKTTSLDAQITEIETRKKRGAYADAQPIYLENPLKKDGTLVISDRRIPFNGPVTSTLATQVTTQINYFNNKDPKKPIFIVIDDSPGGSVMAGYRILKAMEGSEAPVYVVVKSFAASMAACITTLAEKSYAYPNAIILHHQISSTYFFTSMNLTDQKEAYEDMKRWWNRLADPISQKMGITSDEFIEQMYEKTKSGDWTEFGDDAKKLKWVDNIVERIHETSLLKDPTVKKPTTKREGYAADLTYGVDEKGKLVMFLPRRNPKDVYFMFNPDGYYRFK